MECAVLFPFKNQLKRIKWNDIKAGDVDIKGGSSGHAVLINDVTMDKITGEHIFLLTQSFMTAHNIHLLLNKTNNSLSLWYLTFSIKYLETP